MLTNSQLHTASNMLDVPNFFWESEPTLYPLYIAVREYLEIKPRIQVLNERCRVFLDLAEILSDSIADNRTSRMFCFALLKLHMDNLLTTMGTRSNMDHYCADRYFYYCDPLRGLPSFWSASCARKRSFKSHYDSGPCLGTLCPFSTVRMGVYTEHSAGLCLSLASWRSCSRYWRQYVRRINWPSRPQNRSISTSNIVLRVFKVPNWTNIIIILST